MKSGGKVLSEQGKASAYGSAGTDAVLLAAQIAAILSVGAGAIHFSAAGDHTDLPVMFVGFAAVAILQIGLGVLLLRRPPSRPLLLAGVLMMLSSIGLWLLSRTVGLPFLPDGHVEPIGFKDGVTKLFEIASIPVLLLLMSPELARVSMPSPRLPSQALGLVGAACLALTPPALMLNGGHQHSHEQAVALGLHDHGGEQLAHAEAGSSHSRANHGNGKSTHDSHSSGGHAHTPGATAAAHKHSGAGTSLGVSHRHGVAPAPAGEPHQHSDRSGGDHGGGNQHQRRGGDHHPGGDHDRDRPGDKPHGRDHDHDHDHGDGDQPSNDQPITVSYEPEPGICLGGADICVP